MSASASDEPVGAERSLGALVAAATSEMSALVHDEIALAKAQLRQDVKRGVVGGGAFMAAGVLLVFSLPMLSFALAFGIRVWSGWPMWACFLLSFAASVVVALLLALVGLLFVKKAKRGRGAQKAVASAKETAAVLNNVKPHPRTALPAQSGPHAGPGGTAADATEVRGAPKAVEGPGAHGEENGNGATVARSSS